MRICNSDAAVYAVIVYAVVMDDVGVIQFDCVKTYKTPLAKAMALVRDGDGEPAREKGVN